MKKYYIYQNHNTTAPIIYLNEFEGTGEEVWKKCVELNVPNVTLVVITGLDWDKELSPWQMEPVFKGNQFTGGAETYLKELTEEIIPAVEKEVGVPSKRIIAGYSLAGLFSLYAAFKSELFTNAISASGSLWFKDFTNYLKDTTPNGELQSVYLSLGDKESDAKNEIMKTVKDKTVETKMILEEKGITVTYEENPGNHFMENDIRVAKGISWILNHLD